MCFVILPSCYAKQRKVESRWWPEQKAPRGVVKSLPHNRFEPSDSPNGKTNRGEYGANFMMIQSLAGLAARAVNEDKCDEMIWVEVGHPFLPLNPDYQLYYNRAKKRLGFEERGTFGSWDLVKRFFERGVARSYVLYSYDYSEGDPYVERVNADRTVNAATMAAAAEGALLIEEGQKQRAEEIGLKMVFDARRKTAAEVFDRYKDRLNRRFFASIDPKVAHCRDFAIAYKCAVAIGIEEPIPTMLKWLEPLSPVLGYLWKDELGQTVLVSSCGHFNTATNWSLNMPLFLAASSTDVAVKATSINPATIDYGSSRYATAFVITDGDNMSWMMGDFAHNRMYWASELRGQVPFGWTSCFANLSQVCGPAVEYLLNAQTRSDTFIEYGGGYQYPDVFARNRPNRRELLVQFAQRTGLRMSKLNIKVFGFLCKDFDSSATLEACEIYAQHMPGLVGMIAVQYYPYEGGEGDIIWVKNSTGVEIPAVRASFALWAHYNRPTGGTPAKVARLLNESKAKARAEKRASYNWVAIHAWSGFRQNNGDDELAENGHFLQPQNETALVPVKWTIDRLDEDIKVVTPEELLWLIRMEHNPAQTRKVIAELNEKTRGQVKSHYFNSTGIDYVGRK